VDRTGPSPVRRQESRAPPRLGRLGRCWVDRPSGDKFFCKDNRENGLSSAGERVAADIRKLFETISFPGAFLSYPFDKIEHMFDGFDEAQTRSRVGGGDSDAGDVPGGGLSGGGRGAAPWVGVTVPMVVPVGWSHGHIRQGLAELERIHREYEAANAVLIAALPATRDLTADLTRNNGISTREAKRQREMADVTKKLPDALTKLRNGEISADHVTALSSVKDLEGAEKLLEGAGRKVRKC
jgi:hypothetical protein